jgi:hypothetical protein
MDPGVPDFNPLVIYESVGKEAASVRALSWTTEL